MSTRLQARKMPRQHRRSPLLWLIPTQAMAIAAAIAAAAGENLLRAAMLGGMLWAMMVPLIISLEAGLTAIMIFEPFHGFLRRAQYIFLPYSQNEPIHVLAPIATLGALLMTLFRHKLDTIRLTPLAGAVTVLAAICFVQIFNPLQGGLFVGFTGALFYLVPMAWFYFGQTVRKDFVPSMLRLIVALGLITSFYGVYQLVFGYPYFEKYWIENTDLYNSIAVYNIQRALATFNNSEEWGRYIQIGCTIAFGLGISRSEGNKRVLWLTSTALLFVMLAFTGQRTSIFGLLLSFGVLFLTGAQSFQAAIARLLLMFMPVLLIVALSKPTSEDAGYELDESNRVGTMLTHTTKGTVDPTSEGSLYARFKTWSRIVTVELPANPFGSGLGITTLAASRNNISDSVAVDNHFISLAKSAGVPAALILFWILIRAFIFCFRGWRYSEPHSEQANLWRILMALTAAFILNNFFGTSFTIYSVAPIGWLLVGSISAAYADLDKAGETTGEVEILDRDAEWSAAKNISY